MSDSLPIDEIIPALKAALRERPNAVVVAPPGAGKTTRLPLTLLDEPWAARGRILILEPRRLAARAAAQRMADTRGERVGETVGLRVRLETRIGPRTRIEVLTEGVFTRMILDDAMLDGVAAVIFDEFHERSLEADLGLALALDAQAGLREDLRILAMSATLDGAAVARLLDAPVLESRGRAFPVETRYLGRDPRRSVDEAAADAAMRALAAEPGSLLVFLPGAREIRRAERRLAEQVRDPAVRLAPLYGALDRAAQDAAVSPAPPGTRKIVLATSIAETSLTIEGVRVVIDSGFSRAPRYEPGTGLTRLETVRVSRAAADQRRGRAGRTAPGVCYRLWDEPETRALRPYDRPEILEADLGTLVLALAEWGVADPSRLAWLDPPPEAALREARALLRGLDALDADGRITPQGRRLARLPLPPRLAHMIVAAGGAVLPAADVRLAAGIAALLSERGLGGRDVDLRHRLAAFLTERSERAWDARRLAESWARLAGARPESRDAETGPLDRAGALLALAYPDRIAKARPGRPGAYLLANGRGASLDAAEPLARETWLAVGELSGGAAEARILSAAPLTEAEVERLFDAHVETVDDIRFDAAARALRARRERRLGALVLSSAPLPVPPGPAAAAALLEGLRDIGLEVLPWSKALTQWRDRVAFLRRAEGDPWPDLSDEALRESLGDWLGPYVADKTALERISTDDLRQALEARLSWELRRRLDREAPTHFEAPSGSRLPIRYEAEGPVLAVRVQELFGLAEHPTVAGVPLTLELLSPAHRPVQVTRDLPGFWRGSYQAVKAEMKGRYPKHPWPDDPLSAPATARAKPRGA